MNMTRIIFYIVLTFIGLVAYSAMASLCNYIDAVLGKDPPLDKLIAAMIEVESNGDDNAIGRNGEVGCLQIKEIVVKDVNRIISTTPAFIHNDLFDMDDRYNRKKSIEICTIYMRYYGFKASNENFSYNTTMEMCARIWNGGPNGWRLASTEKYWQKVQKAMRR